MESKKINQLATELAPDLSDLTIIGDPTTGISKKITLSQMASLFTGTVEEYANLAAFPLVGVADTIYIALDTNIIYRWNTGTSAYVELSPNIVTSLVFSDANGFDGTISLVGSTATLTITTALTTGSVPFIGASGALSQDNANLFFDDTNNRLGINTNAPTTALDVFGSGIIGRINGTSTNNAYLGFASAGTNKWSIGNVQSDHRFRIYNEATTSELVSVLSTGEFGIGITNPTTKVHIDGGATALIANLDANVSVAKSISFRSDNSARINLEVSGTESGSNAGADLFIRTYTDAGALLATPLFIKRSTGNIGVNTSSPSGEFHVKAISGFAELYVQGAGSTSGMYLFDNNTESGLWKVDSGYMAFGTNNTERINISSTGLFTYQGTGNGIPLRFQDISAAITGQTAGYIGMSTSAFSGNNGDLVLYPRTSAASKILLMGGNVGINTTTPASLLHVNYAASGSSSVTVAKFSVQDTTGYGVTNPAIEFVGTNIGLSFTIGKIAGINDATSGGSLAFSTGNSGTVTERFRITSGGQVNVNSSQTTFPFYVQSAITNWATVIENTANGGSGILMRSTGGSQGYYYGAYDGGAYKFFVNGSGVVNSTSNSITIISSDAKLKTDIRDYNKGLAEVLAMKPRIYKRKDNLEIDEVGFIAQEMDIALAGSMIESYKNEEGEPIHTYQLEWYPLLVKAIQEQQAQIEELKAKIK